MASRLTAILAGSVAVGMVLAAAGFLLPGSWDVERTVEVQAPAPTVFRLVDTYDGWTTWGATWSQDPGTSFARGEGPASGAGTEVRWVAHDTVQATLTIRSAQAPSSVDYDLVWANGVKVHGRFALKPHDEATEVTWATSGDLGVNPITRWMAFLFHGTMGRQFDRGLTALAAEAEREASEQVPPPVQDAPVPIEVRPSKAAGAGAAYEGP